RNYKFKNRERVGGTSKRSFFKLLDYGVDGIISFNNKPLRLLLYLGFIICLLSIIYISYHFINILMHGINLPIYFTTIFVAIFLLYLGFLICLFIIIYISYHFINILMHGINLPGYFTTIFVVLFLGGVQLISISIIGEYVGRIYYEVKARPHYLIKDINLNDY